MFKKTSPVQTDLFKDLGVHLSDRKVSILDDPNAWHNIFLTEVTQRVDETVFEPLFKSGGRPNAPLRILLSMMVLKEGNGWSDEQLFDNCRFNIRCMRALGLYSITDDIPVESTYYELRRRLAHYHSEHGGDLMGDAFRCATRGQINAHNIKGDKIRMDSKLIQSNIVKASRLELILETVRASTTSLDLAQLSEVLDKADITLLESLGSKTTSNVAYPLDSTEKISMLERLGYIIKELLPYCSKQGALARLYKEQYQEIDDQEQDKGKDSEDSGKESAPKPKPTKNITSYSMQSVHDPQAAFRRKGHGKSKQQVAGYHSNITETCDEENAINLVVDVQVEPANSSENTFLLPAIEKSNEVLDNQGVKHVTTDGGYDSLDNREIMAGTKMPHWNMATHKGVQQRYHLCYDENDTLLVYCKKTQTDLRVTFSKKVNKYVFHHTNGTKRYLTKQDVQGYLLLQDHLASINEKDVNLRPNVESTIHQVFHRLLKRNKMKYRGIYKCNLYCISRAYWTNFRRILKNNVEQALVSLLSPFWTLKHLLLIQQNVFPLLPRH